MYRSRFKIKNACADNSHTSALPTLENASLLHVILILETLLHALHVLTVQVRNEELEQAATLGFDQQVNSLNHVKVKIEVF